MHPDTDTNTPVEVEIDAEFAERLRDAQQAYDEVREYLENLKDEAKARYGVDHDKVVGTFAGEKVFDCVRRSTTRINSSRLKRDYPSIWDAYSVTKTTSYLTVARPKAAS